VSSFDRNKKDFEAGLNALAKVQSDLEGVLGSTVLDTIGKVVDEYRYHFQEDIDELVSDLERLREERDGLKAELAFSRSVLADVNKRVEFLENEISFRDESELDR